MVAGLLLALTLAAAPADSVRYAAEHVAMGTTFRLVVYAPDSLTGVRAAAACWAAVDRIEAIASDYRANSEINRLAASHRWQTVSADLYQLLDIALSFARSSGGHYDPTIGPLTKLWRRAFRRGEMPAADRVAAARRRVGYRKVRLGRRSRLRLRDPAVRFDLGGVAKGYALDVAGEGLRAAGLPRFLLDGGGDLLLGDAPPGRVGWLVKGFPEGPRRLAGCGVATSGNQFRYLEHGGRRYGHLIDPRTGYGTASVRPTTVVRPTAAAADAAATVGALGGGVRIR